ncbi:putative phospholipase D (PLD) [Aspergillus undulatus]|uniref:putative phospholipase D (PLD) n=1 Tax=Aspergillus undulatus TaxID=1810928 RepID=UPI003CCDC463
MSHNQDHLAYGQYHGQDSDRAGEGESTRSFVGDTFNMLKSKYKEHQSSSQHGGQAPGNQNQPPSQGYNPGGYGGQQSYPGYNNPGLNQTDPNHSSGNQSHQGKPPKQDKLGGLFGKFQSVVADLGGEAAQRLGTAIDPHGYAEYGAKPQSQNRFGSFAPDRHGNDVQWYVDGCSYFYAVSRALETARESIWILDWWLSPELYLRRPPAKNEQYRLDRLLQAAAQRGVKVNIIVYKEVTQALTLSSHHTKHHLENLHPNIAVFRHPDHLPDRQGLTASITSSLENLSLDALKLGQMSFDAMKGIYGIHEGMILYWAHHEKLCIVDGQIAFMGGLDMCYGRWDTHQHALADVHDHPAGTVFPGQDYNNARVLDFTDVAHPNQNKLDKTQTSRMGWSDVAVSFHGPAVEDIRRMFVERWNFLYDSKYQSRNDTRFSRLALYGRPSSSSGGHSGQSQQGSHQQTPYQPGQQQADQQYTSSPQPGTTPQQYQPAQYQAGQQQYPASPQPGTQSSQPSWSQQQAPYQPSQSQAAHQSYAAPTQPISQSPQPNWNQQQAAHQHAQQPTHQSHPSTPQPVVQSQPSWPQQQVPYQAGQHQSSQQSHPGTPQAASSQPNWSQQQPAYPGQQTYEPAPQGVSELPPPSPQPGWNQQQASYQPGQQSQSGTPQPAAQYPHGQSFPPPPPRPAPNQSSSQSPAPYFPLPPGQPTQESQYSSSRGFSDYYGGDNGDRERAPGGKPSSGSGSSFVPKRFRENFDSLRGELAGQIHQYQDRFTSGHLGRPQQRGNMSCQIVRSCGKWSNGTPTEHSIADAYCEIIRHSEHFIYIENQFFITATGDKQKPVENKIGAAIVERILRAARAGQKYKMIIVIPSVPCFAGDLGDQAALGTRAIMEFQYNSINRGGNSIMELIAKEGYNPMEYIRFYNLRNYDRIKYKAPQTPHQGGGGFGPDHRPAFDTSAAYQYSAPAPGPKSGSGPDTVSSCYMLNGPDLRSIPWDGPAEAEINAFVTEELYVHSKVMIADDRVVICGSANINDRSQVGDHDSEIAVVIEDRTPVPSKMNGQSWTASRFASSLRRHLHRKHLGLLPPQDYEHPANDYFDFDAPESQIVADPLADTFLSLWNTRAHTNTNVFRELFHSVPDDTVRNWGTYKEFYGYYFKNADKQAFGEELDGPPAAYKYGHIVSEKFPGPEGVARVKELLSQVKGTLVEMPLMFLCEEDVAESGLTLNDLTEPLYT